MLDGCLTFFPPAEGFHFLDFPLASFVLSRFGIDLNFDIVEVFFFFLADDGPARCAEGVSLNDLRNILGLRRVGKVGIFRLFGSGVVKSMT